MEELKKRIISFVVLNAMVLGIIPFSVPVFADSQDAQKTGDLSPIVCIATANIIAGAPEVKVNIEGVIPEKSILILQSYPKDETYKFGAEGNGIFIANKANLTAGEDQIIPVVNKNNITVDKKIVAVILCGGKVISQSESVEVITPDTSQKSHISIINEQFTKDSVSADLKIDGCDEYMQGQLIICQYDPAKGNFDPDNNSTMRLFQKNINEQGKLTIEFTPNVPLISGNKIIAYTYKYDAISDSIKTLYSNSVSIISESQNKIETKVEIATSTIRVGDSNIWVICNFESDKYDGNLVIYEYNGNEFNPLSPDNIVLYNQPVTAAENSKKINFIGEELPLKANWNLKAALILTEKKGEKQPIIKYSEPVIIQGPPSMKTPTVAINEKEITEGDNKMKISVNYDKNIRSAEYTVYQYEGESLNVNSDSTKILNSGTASKWNRFPINFAVNYRPLKPESKIVVVLTVTTDDNKTMQFESNVITVGARPDWGTPAAIFEVNSLRSNANSVPITISYEEGYYTLDEFYCNVTLYQYPSSIKNFDHEDSYAEPIGTINGTKEHPILGENIQIPINKPLKPGYKLIAKLRLPHVEWEGEEADYLSEPIDIQSVPLVLLYQLEEETSNGSRLRSILTDLEIEIKNIEKSQLNETIGYLAELNGFEKAKEDYIGEGYNTEFIIMSGLSEEKLDLFLQAMMKQNLRIDHKAAVTETNKNWTFKRLIGDIEDEHEVFMALLELGKLTKEAEEIDISEYNPEKANIFKNELDEAIEVLKTVEPTLENLINATNRLKLAMLELTGKTQLSGQVVLECLKEGDKYIVKAIVTGAQEDATYSYLWSNGESTNYISNVKEDELATISVVVEGTERFWGLLPKAKLKVAEKLKNITLKSESDKIHISWDKLNKVVNTPETTEIIADIFDGKTLLKTVRVSGKENGLDINELASDKVYEINLYAVNGVGRSDVISLRGKLDSSNVQLPDSSRKSTKNHKKLKLNEEKINISHKHQQAKNNNSTAYNFKDSTNHWAKDAITFVAERGVFNGTSDKSFSPNSPVTRAMFITVLGRLSGEDIKNNQNTSFSDIQKDSFYAPYAEWARDKGISNGYNGKFNPDAEITRQDMIVMISRYLEKTGNKIDNKKSCEKFADDYLINDYAKKAVQQMQEAGIIMGKENKNFDPQHSATRAEAAKIITELIKVIE